MYSHNRDKDNFEIKFQQLNQIITKLRAKYFLYGGSEFYFETQRFVQQIRRDINSNCLTYKGGTALIVHLTENLQEQDSLFTFEKVSEYYIVKKEQKDRNLHLVLAQVGFVAGGTQIFGGAGICSATLGAACAAYGVPMMLHGINNAYENGYYLLYRKSKSGGVRDAYRIAAKKLGYGNKQGDLAYGAVDLSLTAYGSFRQTLLPREKSWGLFRHVKADYIRGWQEAGRIPLSLDGLSSVGTVWQLYELKGN